MSENRNEYNNENECLPVAKRTDWEISDMPKKRERFTIKRDFDAQEIASLLYGHIPEEMEDKWFFFMEGNTLYAHRSWTGICIFIVRFDFETGIHKVEMNGDKNSFSMDREEAEELLLSLLDYWSKPNYDYYGEWMQETVKALMKNKK